MTGVDTSTLVILISMCWAASRVESQQFPSRPFLRQNSNIDGTNDVQNFVVQTLSNFQAKGRQFKIPIHIEDTQFRPREPNKVVNIRNRNNLFPTTAHAPVTGSGSVQRPFWLQPTQGPIRQNIRQRSNSLRNQQSFSQRQSIRNQQSFLQRQRNRNRSRNFRNNRNLAQRRNRPSRLSRRQQRQRRIMDRNRRHQDDDFFNSWTNNGNGQMFQMTDDHTRSQNNGWPSSSFRQQREPTQRNTDLCTCTLYCDSEFRYDGPCQSPEFPYLGRTMSRCCVEPSSFNLDFNWSNDFFSSD